MDNLNWYVIRVVSGQEKKVKTYLEKEISKNKMEDQIPEVLTPTEKVYQLRKMRDGKQKKIAVERNFFPGYVMINADLTNVETIHFVNKIPGVIGFLNVEKNDAAAIPKPMRESEVNRILGKVGDTDEHEIKMNATFSEGESVKVIDGPFSGFDGIIEEVFEEKKKLNVVVKIFGRNAPVELSFVQVEKIS